MPETPGIYIDFEGIVGSGKTTQSKLLVKKLQEKFPQKKVIWTREPGGTEIAEAVRKLVQGSKFSEEMEGVCEAYLYAAARAHSLRKVVKPVLAKNGIVVADRSFFSSVTFQGSGRGLGWRRVLDINKEAVKNLWPDLVIFLDLKITEGLKRVADHGGDKFEHMGRDFFNKVRRGYLQLLREYPRTFVKIDASGSVDEVAERILGVVKRKLKI